MSEVFAADNPVILQSYAQQRLAWTAERFEKLNETVNALSDLSSVGVAQEVMDGAYWLREQSLRGVVAKKAGEQAVPIMAKGLELIETRLASDRYVAQDQIKMDSLLALAPYYLWLASKRRRPVPRGDIIAEDITKRICRWHQILTPQSEGSAEDRVIALTPYGRLLELVFVGAVALDKRWRNAGILPIFAARDHEQTSTEMTNPVDIVLLQTDANKQTNAVGGIQVKSRRRSQSKSRNRAEHVPDPAVVQVRASRVLGQGHRTPAKLAVETWLDSNRRRQVILAMQHSIRDSDNVTLKRFV